VNPFTASTIPFLLLVLILSIYAKGQILPLVTFTSVFQAASVVNIGFGGQGFALAPYYVLLIIQMLHLVFGRSRPIPVLPKQQSAITLCLMAFVCYALLSALLCPFFFNGIAVNNPRSGFGSPLSWGTYNLTQSTYLCLGFSLFLSCVYASSVGELTRALNWYLAGETFAALGAIYQFLSFKVGLPFPTEILHSNTQHVIFDAYEIGGGFTRVSSTFTEASAAASHFTVALAFVIWRLLFNQTTWRELFCFLTLLIALVMTTSSSGYIAFAYIVLVTTFLCFRKARATRSTRLFRAGLAIAVMVLVVAVASMPRVINPAIELVNEVLLKKTQTRSYQERTASNEAAITVAGQTVWLGAGWGSLRASSFIANMLGTVGIPGTLCFTIFCILVFRFGMMRRPDAGQKLRTAVLFPVSVVLLNLAVATPEPVDPDIWFLFGVAAFAEPKRQFRGTVSPASYQARNLPDGDVYNPVQA
jgi:O-antigen ligase